MLEEVAEEPGDGEEAGVARLEGDEDQVVVRALRRADLPSVYVREAEEEAREPRTAVLTPPAMRRRRGSGT